MNDLKKKPILVTGSHRSGSTWAGVMLSAPPDIVYVNEPFNIKYQPGTFRPHFQYWYTYVDKENESDHIQYLENCIRYKPDLVSKALNHGSIKDIPKLVEFQVNCYKARLLNKRPLVKDPFAVLSTEWFAKRFDMDVVMLIRHPAAFVGSLKVANWPFQFSHLLKQPLLMEKHFSQYEAEIQDFVENKKDIIDQASLLWNLIYSLVAQWKESYQDRWIFLRHEDLSRDPLEEYRNLYQKLDIPFTAEAESWINQYSFAGSKENKHQKRDSKSNIWKWKQRLTEDEISRIKEKTQDIASIFYNNEDWGI